MSWRLKTRCLFDLHSNSTAAVGQIHLLVEACDQKHCVCLAYSGTGQAVPEVVVAGKTLKRSYRHYWRDKVHLFCSMFATVCMIYWRVVITRTCDILFKFAHRPWVIFRLAAFGVCLATSNVHHQTKINQIKRKRTGKRPKTRIRAADGRAPVCTVVSEEMKMGPGPGVSQGDTWWAYAL